MQQLGEESDDGRAVGHARERHGCKEEAVVESAGRSHSVPHDIPEIGEVPQRADCKSSDEKLAECRVQELIATHRVAVRAGLGLVHEEESPGRLLRWSQSCIFAAAWLFLFGKQDRQIKIELD